MQNGNLLATLRVQKNLSQNKMAKIINTSLSSYKSYETNTRVIKLEMLNLISNFFSVSLDYLLNLSNKTHCPNLKKEIDYNLLGINLTLIRKKYGLKQYELAKMFKINKKTICRYEKNPHFVSVSYLYLFAKKFNISVDYLCGKTGAKRKKEIL